MNSTAITNDTELHHRIMKLNYLKAEQELAIKRNFQELAYSVNPSVLLKNVVSKFVDDEEGVNDLKNVGLNIGKDFLLMKLFGRSGIKGMIASFLIRKTADYVVKNHPNILSDGIDKIKGLISNK